MDIELCDLLVEVQEELVVFLRQLILGPVRVGEELVDEVVLSHVLRDLHLDVGYLRLLECGNPKK